MAPRLDALDPCHDDYNPRRHVFPSTVAEEPLESPLFRDASSVKLSSLDRRVSDPDFQALLGEASRKVESREDATTTSSERSSGSGRSQPRPSRIAELIGSESACAKGNVLVPQSTIAAAANSSIREEATHEKKNSDEKNASRPKAEGRSRSVRRKCWKILKSIPKRIKKTLNDMKYPANEPVPAHVI